MVNGDILSYVLVAQPAKWDLLRRSEPRTQDTKNEPYSNACPGRPCAGARRCSPLQLEALGMVRELALLGSSHAACYWFRREMSAGNRLFSRRRSVLSLPSFGDLPQASKRSRFLQLVRPKKSIGARQPKGDHCRYWGLRGAGRYSSE